MLLTSVQVFLMDARWARTEWVNYVSPMNQNIHYFHELWVPDGGKATALQGMSRRFKPNHCGKGLWQCIVFDIPPTWKLWESISRCLAKLAANNSFRKNSRRSEAWTQLAASILILSWKQLLHCSTKIWHQYTSILVSSSFFPIMCPLTSQFCWLNHVSSPLEHHHFHIAAPTWRHSQRP